MSIPAPRPNPAPRSNPAPCPNPAPCSNPGPRTIDRADRVAAGPAPEARTTAGTGPARPARRWVAGRLTGIRLPRRLVQLYVGLLCYGASSALMVRARLGLDPWDVFHQGLARRLGVPIGWIVIAVGILVLLLWIPLRQRPGLGTVSNAVLIGLAMDATLQLVPAPDPLWLRWVLLLAGIALNGVATGMYIGARFGPGPRDGLMTGLAARGHSVRVVRTGIELTVLAGGFLLGGQVGFGTLIYAVAIGPLAHLMIPLWTVRDRPSEAASRDVTAPVSGGDGAVAGTAADAQRTG